MEVMYKRDRGHNYILFPGKKEAGTQTEMIRRNQIPGLADFYTEWEDNQRYYGYDITGAKPLRQMLEVRPFTRKEAEGLIEELAGILQRMESFLLDRDKLVLKPELLYVYADRQGYVCSDRQGFLFFFCEDICGSWPFICLKRPMRRTGSLQSFCFGFTGFWHRENRRRRNCLDASAFSGRERKGRNRFRTG